MQRGAIFALLAALLAFTPFHAEAKRKGSSSSGGGWSSTKSTKSTKKRRSYSVGPSIDFGLQGADAYRNDPYFRNISMDGIRAKSMGAGITVRRTNYGKSTILEIDTPWASPKRYATKDKSASTETLAARFLGLRKLPVKTGVKAAGLVRNDRLDQFSGAVEASWQQVSSVGARPGDGSRRAYVMGRRVGEKSLLTDGPGKVDIVIPKGMRLTDAPQGAARYFDLASGQCWGLDPACKPLHIDRSAGVVRNLCFPDMPRSVEVHAMGVKRGTRIADTSMRIGRSKKRVGQVDIYVSRTARPAVLMLGATEPTVWSFNASAGSNIAGVLVRGDRSQAVTGLPQDVPIRFSTQENGLQEGLRRIYQQPPKRPQL